MGHPWPRQPAPTGPSGPTGPGRDRPPTPAAVQAAHQRRRDAAEHLIRVTDHARELRQVGRLTDTDRVAIAAAELAWDAARMELDRLVTAYATGGAR